MAGLNPYTFNANPYGVDPNAPDAASRNYEALTRDMWASWTSNFLPYENDLIEYSADPEVVTKAQQGASQNVNAAFDAQQAATGRRLKGLGLTLEADEQKAADRSFGLARSLADVTAQNVAGAKTRERQQAVLGNPAPRF
jgi:hypothetical protein